MAVNDMQLIRNGCHEKLKKDVPHKMNISDILQYSGGGIFLLLTFFEITPIKFNPWTAILKWFGRKTNSEINDQMKYLDSKIDELSEKLETVKEHLDDVEKEDLERHVESKRFQILRFADEERLGVGHSQEYFNQILSAINDYKAYCNDHPEYPNEKAVQAISRILKSYNQHMEDNDFLE